YRNENGTSTWVSGGAGVGPAKVLALAADPKSNPIVYAATSHGVFKTTDAGLNWKISSGLPNDAATSIAVDPINPATVYACLSEGLYQSTDSGGTWKSILTDRVVSVALAATKQGLIYVGRVSAPILRSVDGGASWQEAGTAMTVNALAIDPTNPLTVYA